MAEQISTLGYMALGEQSAEDTPVTPDVFVPYYNEDLVTNMNVDEDTPIVGNRFARYQTLPGQRSHSGEITCIAEPNTSAYIWSMILARGSVSGGGPYTYPFTLGEATPYTVEFRKGRHAFRFWGVKASSITPEFDDNKMLYNISVSAKGSFTTRQVASESGGVITLDTTYDPVPTKGLVVDDIIQIYDVSTGTYINAVVDSLTDTTVTVSEDVSALAAGDILSLRPLTPSYTTVTPFQWARTEFRFGATASAALSATHTPLESGSAWTVMHNFNNDEGEHRSGSFDPAGLVHTRGDCELTATRYFDHPDDYSRFTAVAKRACVIRHFSGTGYELRITMNDLRTREDNTNTDEGDGIILSEITFGGNYDASDGQGMDVKVLNNLSSL